MIATQMKKPEVQDSVENKMFIREFLVVQQ